MSPYTFKICQEVMLNTIRFSLSQVFSGGVTGFCTMVRKQQPGAKNPQSPKSKICHLALFCLGSSVLFLHSFISRSE